MRFVNFFNEATFRFYEWALDSPEIDTDDLIAKALAAVQDQADRENIPDLIEDGLRLSEKLAELIEEKYDDLAGDWLSSATDGAYTEIEGRNISFWYVPGADPAPEANDFFGPLALVAVQSVYFEPVAEALLRQAGKWPEDEPAKPASQVG